jgi:mRNA-degrading endonuclease RelE of RelBE toxin-antitoxin system
MTPPFSVRITPHFDRLARKLQERHPAFATEYEKAIKMLRDDPYNRSRSHPIKKLEGVSQGEGQYRIRLSRFRFRYDIYANEVVLVYCGLRNEQTYR